MDKYSQYENAVVIILAEKRQIPYDESFTIVGVLGFLSMAVYLNDVDTNHVAEQINRFSDC